MDNIDVYAVGTLAIRVINALLWTAVCVTILQRDKPVPRLVRQLITTIIVSGMWALVLGGTTPFGFPSDLARSIYTIFTAYAGLIALGVLTYDSGEDPTSGA